MPAVNHCVRSCTTVRPPPTLQRMLKKFDGLLKGPNTALLVLDGCMQYGPASSGDAYFSPSCMRIFSGWGLACLVPWIVWTGLLQSCGLLVISNSVDMLHAPLKGGVIVREPRLRHRPNLLKGVRVRRQAAHCVAMSCNKLTQPAHMPVDCHEQTAMKHMQIPLP